MYLWFIAISKDSENQNICKFENFALAHFKSDNKTIKEELSLFKTNSIELLDYQVDNSGNPEKKHEHFEMLDESKFQSNCLLYIYNPHDKQIINDCSNELSKAFNHINFHVISEKLNDDTPKTFQNKLNDVKGICTIF